MRAIDLEDTATLVEHVARRLAAIEHDVAAVAGEHPDNGTLWGASVGLAELADVAKVLRERL